MTAHTKVSNNFRRLVFLALLAWASISLYRTLVQAFSHAGGNDLYTYWYAGHFLRHSLDPYASFIQGILPPVPVTYLDKTALTLDEVLFPGLVPAPASTLPVFFLLAPLAFLSWDFAKITWLVINLLLICLMPVLLGAAIHKQKWLSRWEMAALGLALLGLASTRFAAASGQLTFLILDLMLATLILSDHRPWLAGACLGLALSKYSLSIGLFIVFLLFDPNPRLLLGAALVQLAGVIGLMFLSGSGFMEILNEYLRMALWHAGREGIHLAATFRAQEYLLWIALGMTLLVAIPLVVWSIRNAIWQRERSFSSLSRFHFATILLMWSLLIGYHRAYDAVAAIVFFTLVIYLVKKPEFWAMQPRMRMVLTFFAGFAFLLMMVPSGSIVRGILPDSWESIWGLVENISVTILILLFLAASITLLFKSKFNNENLLAPNPR